MAYGHAMNLAWFNDKLVTAKQAWVLNDGSEFFGTYEEATAKNAELEQEKKLHEEVVCCCGETITAQDTHVELEPDGILFHGNWAGGGHKANVKDVPDA